MNTVIEYLKNRELQYELFMHSAVYRALDRAARLQMDPSYIVKAVLLRVGTEYALAILPASKRISISNARLATNCMETVLASEAELAAKFNWCELGALPALPEFLQIPGYVDYATMDHEDGIIATGKKTQSARLNLFDLFKKGDIAEASLG